MIGKSVEFSFVSVEQHESRGGSPCQCGARKIHGQKRTSVHLPKWFILGSRMPNQPVNVSVAGDPQGISDPGYSVDGGGFASNDPG